MRKEVSFIVVYGTCFILRDAIASSHLKIQCSIAAGKKYSQDREAQLK